MSTADSVKRTYYSLTLFTTLSASFIWGINTLFLLDAGLSNTEAFAANAFYTLGMVIFEIPTGVVADSKGRRMSFLIGTVTLLLSTLAYLWLWQNQSEFIYWAIASGLLGLGFTFFSGAVEAWVVDALTATGYTGTLDSVFARNQMMSGIAMLVGSVAGGVIAQYSNLGVPYIIRSILLVGTFVFAFVLMKDVGFSPATGKGPIKEMKNLLAASVEHGLKQPTIRRLMFAAPFSGGVLVYAFYAMQPYLLELYGDKTAYAVAGLAAAIVAGAQMVGSILVPKILKLFSKRTSILLLSTAFSALILVLIGWVSNFYLAVSLLIAWSIVVAGSMPVRQSLMNNLIPSQQRATVLSFDSLMASSGGVVTQPALGRAADVWSYSASYLICGVVQLVALPFILKARRTCNSSDVIES